MRMHILAIAVSATALIATPAIASPANQTDFAATVEYDDLDLATREGVSRLDERIRTRIRQMCANGGRDSASLRLERECRATALASAEDETRVAIANAEARAANIRFAQNSSSEASDAATPGA